MQYSISHSTISNGDGAHNLIEQLTTTTASTTTSARAKYNINRRGNNWTRVLVRVYTRVCVSVWACVCLCLNLWVFVLSIWKCIVHSQIPSIECAFSTIQVNTLETWTQFLATIYSRTESCFSLLLFCVRESGILVPTFTLHGPRMKGEWEETQEQGIVCVYVSSVWCAHQPFVVQIIMCFAKSQFYTFTNRKTNVDLIF